VTLEAKAPARRRGRLGKRSERLTILVTGASGFVGSAVVRALLAQGEAVRVLLRPASQRANISGLDVEVVTGDLRDPASLKQAVAGCAGLYHVAADYRLWVADPRELYGVNVDGTRALMLAAAEAGATRIVYTSSVAALGLSKDGRPADEETPARLEDMIGHYKRSKYLAEAEVRRLVESERLPAVIVNPSTPIGPRDIKPTPTGRIIVEAAAGRMPAYVDTGLNVVHVDDVAAGHLLAFEHGTVGERYVLGSENMRLAEILGEVARLVRRRPPSVRLPHGLVMPVAVAAEAWAHISGSGEPFVTRDGLRMARKLMFFSSAKAEQDLGYVARPARDALRDAVDWFREHGYVR
jgi:dihydroflavonol-4-reductase